MSTEESRLFIEELEKELLRIILFSGIASWFL
jgi:hypothetical protein